MKLDRLLALTMLLANNRRVTASELAQRFEVSVRTILRDVEALDLAGIPVVTYRGRTGGIGLMEGYSFDRSLFTTGEIFSVLAMLEDVTAVTGDQMINNALDKLKGLLPDDRIECMRPLGRGVVLDLAPWTGSRDERACLQQLRSACTELHPVVFNYTNKRGEILPRTVEPVIAVLRKDAWYLYGFCRMRQDFRVFKLSRISDLQVLDETCQRHSIDPSERPWDSSWNEESEMLTLVVRFSPAARARVLDEFDPDKIRVDEQGYLLVTSGYPDGEWLYSQLLSFGAQAEVLRPQSVRERLAERTAEILALYSSKHDNGLS